MNPEQLEQRYRALCEDPKTTKWGLAPVQIAGLETIPEEFESAEEAWKAFTRAAPRAGWVQWQSRQTHFEGELPQPRPEWGAVLAAEAALSDTDSLRLDHLEGRWRLVRYRHLPDGGQYLCDETDHLLHGARDRCLRYRRYWRIDDEQGAVQRCAVLIGIASRED